MCTADPKAGLGFYDGKLLSKKFDTFICQMGKILGTNKVDLMGLG